VFTARYGLIAYIKQIPFRLQNVSTSHAVNLNVGTDLISLVWPNSLPILSAKSNAFVISGLRGGVNDILALLWCYAIPELWISQNECCYTVSTVAYGHLPLSVRLFEDDIEIWEKENMLLLRIIEKPCVSWVRSVRLSVCLSTCVAQSESY
jgi:hypothetical protein